ncbi:MAG: hypothetical protein AB7O52_03090 [Planctomycetota bacterium]
MRIRTLWMGWAWVSCCVAGCAGSHFDRFPTTGLPGGAESAWLTQSAGAGGALGTPGTGVVYANGETTSGELQPPEGGVLGAPDDTVDDMTVDAGETLGPPCFTAEVTLAMGRYTHRTSGSALDDREVAGLSRLRIEFAAPAGVGFGAAVEGMTSDDDLFEEDGFAAQEASMSDVFVYVLFQPGLERRIRVPIRVGPYFRGLQLEDDAGPDEVTWGSVGFRAEIEPEVVIVADPHAELSVFAGVGLGYHGTVIEVDTPSTSFEDQFESDGSTLGVEAGLRGRVYALAWALSYIYRGVRIDESDPELGLFVRETQADFQGVAFTLGVRF